MLQTNPITNSISEEGGSSPKHQYELYSFDFLACPAHPGFAVEVFCAIENYQPNLLCIKCILDPDISKDIRGINLIAIRDLITESVEKTNYATSTSANLLLNESFERNYLEFDRRDYLKVFERHVENQMKKLDRDIERIRESMQKLREQFVHFFSKQTQTLLKYDEDIKKKMQQYVIEKDELNKVSFYTVSDLLRQLHAKKNYKEYERFIRLLYKKCHEPRENEEDCLQKKISELMDGMKTQVIIMKGMKIDTQILDKIREQIDTIKIFDSDTFESDLAPLDPKLERLLEKLRRSDKNPKMNAIDEITPNRSKNKRSVMEALKKRLRLEKTEQSKWTNQNDGERLFDKERLYQNASDTKMSEKKGLWNLSSKTQQGSFNDICRQVSPWYEPKIQSNLLHTSKQEKALVGSEISDDEKHGNDMDLEQEKNEQQKLADRSLGFNEFYNEIYSHNPHSSTNRRSNLVGYQASSPLGYQKEREKSVNQGVKGSNDDHLVSQNDVTIHTQFEESSNDFENSRGNFDLPEKNVVVQEGTPHYLINQWVDEKLNGFIVFQNGLRNDNMQQSNDEFNKLSSKQWFQLSRAERDHYTRIAMVARPAIKEELRRCENSNLSELREMANQKIKQIKK